MSVLSWKSFIKSTGLVILAGTICLFAADSSSCQSRGGITFSNGGSRSAIPQFGGYDPGAAARFGFQTKRFGLGLTFGQGSTRSHSFNGITTVVPNGGYGSFFSGTVTPFVTGVIPVVGNNVYGPYQYGPYNYGPYNYGPYNYGPYHYGPYHYGPYGRGCFRPIAYGIQTAPFIAPGSVWMNYQAPAPAYGFGNVRITQPRVSRLASLIQQNGGPNRALNLSSPSPKPSVNVPDVDIHSRISSNSINSTADKAVKSLAEIRKEMKLRKAAEARHRYQEIWQYIRKSEGLFKQGKKSLALKYAKRARGKLRKSESDLMQTVESLIQKIEGHKQDK